MFDMFSTASLTSVWDSAIVTPERFPLASGCEDDEGLAYRGIGGSGGGGGGFGSRRRRSSRGTPPPIPESPGREHEEEEREEERD